MNTQDDNNENKCQNGKIKEEISCSSAGCGGSCACTSGGSKSMFKALLVFIIVLLAITYFQNKGGEMPEEASSIWKTDYSEALKQAKEQDKPVLISFHTSWCGWCKKMKSDVYSDPAFYNYASAELIPVLLDGDKDTDLVAKYNIKGYPSYVILKPDGTVLKTFSGYMKTDAFIETIKSATN